MFLVLKADTLVELLPVSYNSNRSVSSLVDTEREKRRMSCFGLFFSGLSVFFSLCTKLIIPTSPGFILLAVLFYQWQ